MNCRIVIAVLFVCIFLSFFVTLVCIGAVHRAEKLMRTRNRNLKYS